MARYALPPRQKMINLLYILLIAMLAINTTSDAQKKEKQRYEKELQQLTEVNKDLGGHLQQEKISRSQDNQAAQAKEATGPTEQALLVNDTPVRLATNGQLETPVVMVASSSAHLLYSSYRNPLAITTIGIKASELHLEMQNGTVQRNGKDWTAMPDADASEVKLLVSYRKTGDILPIGEYRFRVKALPSPTSYLRCAKRIYRGNVPVRRSLLLAATEVGASTTEPDTELTVVSFETILIKENGKQISTVHAEGNQLTIEQKGLIGQLEEGDSFYITSIMTESPDGKKRQSSPINVIVIK